MRVQVEISYLEQTPTLPDRPPPDYYTGRATSQGFTQRGQVLGAGIGPGSSSQFIAMDRLAPRWQVGLFGGRVRRENDALYRQVLPRFIDHDVEVYAGIRGGLLLARGDVSAELAVGKRQNYLFENAFHLGEPVVANDVQNVTISLMMTPHLRKAGR